LIIEDGGLDEVAEVPAEAVPEVKQVTEGGAA
jgi:hypothetical protein